MKKILLSIIVFFSSCLLFSAPRYTSDYYKSDPVGNLNKVVTLYIHSAKPSSFAELKGYVSFMCHTAYKNELAGIAWVFVPSDKAKSFSRKYGEVKDNNVIAGNAKSFPSKAAKVKMIELKNEYVFVLQ